MGAVLLDADISAGVLSEKVYNRQSKADFWMEAVKELVVGLDNVSFIISTPTFYELAAKDVDMNKAIEDLRESDGEGFAIFRYINYSVTPDVLMLASKYRVVCKKYNFQGVSFCDSIMAAYCLKHGHDLITCNSKDFPPCIFDEQKIVTAPLPRRESRRKVVYLLSPNHEKWNELCVEVFED